MGRRERRQFTPEFKRETVKAAGQPGRSVSAVARELDIDRSVLERWVKSFAAGKCEKDERLPLKSAQQRENAMGNARVAVRSLELPHPERAARQFALAQPMTDNVPSSAVTTAKDAMVAYLHTPETI